MKFAEAWWLLGSAFALVVAGLYIWGGIGLIAALKRYGQPPLVERLLSARSGGRRALKGSLVVLAVAFAFVALAGPQYGRGTRLIPATNLDCVIVLDYSKSMYARDISPSRTERAKAEVARLIAQLPGARFGGVAFAGESVAFPLTSDGTAIAQFFRQNTPNDMPVGGTAIARALESARELLARDPLSQKHQKVIVLVTDGEDLEGDPVQVATTAAKDHVIIHVVQIGGRAPEPIPEVTDNGQVTGLRKDEQGKPLTTALSAAGEAQLAEIAKAAGGYVVRAESGQTGVEEIARRLKQLMKDELAERVETVYADIFFYPLGLAILLLLIESFIPLAQRNTRSLVTFLLLVLGAASGCQEFDKQSDRAFTRYAPEVDDAIEALGTRDAGTSARLLSDYLSTGACKNGEIGVPDKVRAAPYASLDLGLALFEIAERFGGKFGEVAPPQEQAAANPLLTKRSAFVDCALRLVRVIAQDVHLSAVQRAEAFFLSGNLEFLRFDYKAAVSSYEESLRLAPGGDLDAGYSLGSDAAFNRAIALRRIEEQKKNEPPKGDAGTPQDQDQGGNQDSDKDKKSDKQKQDPKSDKQDQDNKQDGDQDKDKPKPSPSTGGSSPPPEKAPEPQDKDKQGDDKQQNGGNTPPPAAAQSGQAQAAAVASSPSLSQDDRILDALEHAPLIHQGIRSQHPGRAVRGMADK